MIPPVPLRGVERGEFFAVSQRALLKTLLADDVDAERTILVAESDDGDITAQGVLNLNDLLLGGSNVGAVGDDEVMRKLLRNGDASAGILDGGIGNVGGIDAEMADAEKALDTAA